MTALELDEERVPARLDEVRDVASSQPVEIQPGVESEGVTVAGEPRVDPLEPDPLPALRRPQSRRSGCSQVGPELGDRGKPRTVNNICTAALIATAGAGKNLVDHASARAAIAEVTATD